MANWTGSAPANPEKPDWLHDQDQLPDAPARDWMAYARFLLPLVFGLAFTGALVAMAFWARDSWGSHRDWVVPATIPFMAIGGVALGYLVARRAWMPMGVALLFLATTGALVASNIWRGAVTDGSDGLRDTLSIISGVFIGLTIAAAIGGMIFTEATDPTKPAAPEM